MFGLLDGYYHTKLEPRQGQKVCVPSKVRYKQYLDAGVFTDLKYPGEGTYTEIEEKDKKAGRKQSRPLNAIMSIAGECKTEIADALFKLIDSGTYKKCSTDAVFDKETGQRTDLPRPRFTLENFLPKTSKGIQTPPNAPPGTQPKLKPHPRTRSIKEKLKGLLANKKVYTAIYLIVIAICLVVITVSVVKQAFFNAPPATPVDKLRDYGSDISVTEIEFSISQITIVHLEETILLPIRTRPDDLHDAYIICSSSDETVVSAIDGGRVIAWKNTAPDNPVTITATPRNRASPDVYDTIDIIVNCTEQDMPAAPTHSVTAGSVQDY